MVSVATAIATKPAAVTTRATRAKRLRRQIASRPIIGLSAPVGS